MINDVRYFYNGEPYRFNGDLFDSNAVFTFVPFLVKRDYSQFVDEINAEGGWLEVHLSHNYNPVGIHYELNVEGVSESLREKIHQSLRRNQ